MFALIKTILNRAVFAEVTPLIRQGRQKPLQTADLPALPAWLEPAAGRRDFAGISAAGPWQLFAKILWLIRRRFTVVLAVLAGAIGVGLALPLTMRALISSTQELCLGHGDLPHAVLLAAGFAALLSLSSLLMQHYLAQVLALEQHIINGLNSRVYAQALGLARKARAAKPIGDLINLLGSDCSSIAEIPMVTAEVLYGIAVVFAVCAMGYWLIGVAAFFALGTLVVLSPLCLILAKRFVRADEQIMTFRDQRVTLMSQILSGIRVVKYLAWEGRLVAEVDGIRNQELAARRRLALAQSASVLLFLAAQSLSCLAALGGYVLLGHKLDMATAFAVIALLDLWQHTFANLPQYVADLAAAKVGAVRLLDFYGQDQQALDERSEDCEQVPGLCLNHFAAGASDSNGEAVIRDWDLSLRAGSATAVVGAVGAGKSTFLLALLGEVPKRHGDLRWVGLGSGRKPCMAWVPQSPFVLSGSIKDNILLGRSDGDDDLPRLVGLSALSRDLATMPGGLETKIGEQGINLSGGQKQRLSLARAAAQKPTVALLDDPFSAVDPATETPLVDELVFGEWDGVTRVVATHRLDHLHRFDTVVFIDKGAILATGTLADLLRWSAAFRTFYAEHQQLTEKAKSHGRVSAPADAAVASPTAVGELTSAVTDEQAGQADFHEQEDRETGHVQLNVYFDYLRALGGGWPRSSWTLLMILTVLAAGLPLWAGRLLAEAKDLSALAVYGEALLAGVALAYIRHLLWGLAAIKGGKQMHDKALVATLAAPVRFFDQNPVGRILNRFSIDVDAVERQMSGAVEQMVFAAVRAALVLGIILVVSPWTTLILVPGAIAFYKLQRDYRLTARETKRLNSITRSPRFAHFKETLEGLETVRAFSRQGRFWQEFDRVLRLNQISFRAMVLANRWFSVRLPMVTAVVSFASVAAALTSAKLGLLTPTKGALLLFYNLMFADYLTWFVRAFSEAEARLTSVERLRHYGQRAPEQDLVLPAATLPALWPSRGALSLANVRARYGAELPEVLCGVNLEIAGGDKIGIIGRTGAGKTSLIQVFYRFMELDSGAITLDGINIAAVPKARLRQALAIIPQSPTLFVGTLRQNLDRFHAFSDAQVWDALAQVQLAELVRQLPGQLVAPVQEGGGNFSDGQRQLLCLARALLSEAKVIIMDEATASVDVVTDQMIHRAIQQAFVGRTMLIIAHRLGTVAHCDQIVELEAGRVKAVRRGAQRQESPRSTILQPVTT